MSLIVPKPWGSETIFTEKNLPYTGKILSVKAGCRLSLQTHTQKTETLTLVSGTAKITIGHDSQTMTPEEGYTIFPNTIHRIEAITDSQVLEVSTPLEGVTHRLEDDYQRTDENLSND